jgi:hypothetical protein
MTLTLQCALRRYCRPETGHCDLRGEYFVVGEDWNAGLYPADRNDIRDQPGDVAHRAFVVAAGLMNLAPAGMPRAPTYFAHSDARLHRRINDSLVATDISPVCLQLMYRSTRTL